MEDKHELQPADQEPMDSMPALEQDTIDTPLAELEEPVQLLPLETEAHPLEAPAEEAPLEMPVEESVPEDAPDEDVTSEDIFAEEITAEDVSAEEITVEEAPTTDIPMEEVPSEAPSVELPAGENAPVDEIPAVEISPEEPAPEPNDGPDAAEFVESFFTEGDTLGDSTEELDIPSEMPVMEYTAPDEPPIPEAAFEDMLLEEVMMLTGDYPEAPADTDSLGDTMLFSAPDTHDDMTVDAILADFSEEAPGISDDSFAAEFPAEPPVDQAFLGTEEDKQEFDKMFAEKPNGEEPPPKKHTPRPVKKGRPKRKKGDGLLGIPHVLVTIVWLAIIVLIGSSLGKLLWMGAADVLAFGRDNKDVTVTIVDTDTIDTIAAKLQEAGLVKYPEVFKVYAQLTGAEEEIITGTFELNTRLDYHALVNSLSATSSNRTVIQVMIPEGYNCRQIFALLEENNVCSVASLEAYAADGQFSDFWFLENVARGDKYCLEGFLFPDTYQFYVNSTPREALGKMLTGFDNRFSDEMRELIPVLNERLSAMMRNNGCTEEFIAENQFTVRELVIVASLIEEETASADESPNIASVIYNRLTSKDEYNRYLGIDATILYALGEHKEELTSEDLAIDSPFNTRIYAGLTPTPISNPGLNSLQAALEPADTGYYYYVLNPNTRLHQFSKTYEEHLKWVEEFRGE